MDDTAELSETEITRRRDAALLRALNTPHKRQSEMKIGKSRTKPVAERGSLTKDVKEREEPDDKRDNRNRVRDFGGD